MEIKVVIESILAMLIMILVGVYARRRNIITQEINKGLVDILIQIALPFMIFSSFLHTFDSTIKENLVKTVYYSLGAYLLMGGVSQLLLWPVKNDKKTILHFANVFVNTGYVGFPILNSLYGPEGVVYGSIFNMFFVIFLWTYGILLFKGRITVGELKLELKKVLLNPSIHAVCLGLLVMSFHIQLPGAITSAARSIGSLTGPLSMIIIGCILAKVKLKTFLGDWTIYYGVIIQLILMPMFSYLVASWFIGTASIVVKSVLVMTALPASAMTSIFADAFNKEKEYAAFVVSITTLLSLFTLMFFIAYLL